MPVFNESEVLQNTINSIQKNFHNIIAINDASTDNSLEILQKNDIFTINHPINLGQGAAIDTGFRYIIQETKASAVVTFDADGQHDADDAKRFAEEILKCDEEIIFGTRFLKYSANIPFFKKLLLRTAILLTNIIMRTKLTDTHNGLKAYKREAINKINIVNNGYSFESEILMEVVKNHISYKEMSTNIKYTEYSIKKGQSIRNSIIIAEDILKLIIKRFIN